MRSTDLHAATLLPFCAVSLSIQWARARNSAADDLADPRREPLHRGIERGAYQLLNAM